MQQERLIYCPRNARLKGIKPFQQIQKIYSLANNIFPTSLASIYLLLEPVGTKKEQEEGVHRVREAAETCEGVKNIII